MPMTEDRLLEAARGGDETAFAGLVQDSLSSSVIGIGGLAKTIVGFLAGIIGSQFIVAQSLPRFVVFFGATVLHAIVFMGLYVLLDLINRRRDQHRVMHRCADFNSALGCQATRNAKHF